MRAKALNQLIAAKAAAENLLSPKDTKKACDKQNQQNMRDRAKLPKLTAACSRRANRGVETPTRQMHYHHTSEEQADATTQGGKCMGLMGPCKLGCNS